METNLSRKNLWMKRGSVKYIKRGIRVETGGRRGGIYVHINYILGCLYYVVLVLVPGDTTVCLPLPPWT